MDNRRLRQDGAPIANIKVAGQKTRQRLNIFILAHGITGAGGKPFTPRQIPSAVSCLVCCPINSVISGCRTVIAAPWLRAVAPL